MLKEIVQFTKLYQVSCNHPVSVSWKEAIKQLVNNMLHLPQKRHAVYKACRGAVTFTICSEKFCVINTVNTIEIHVFGSFAWGWWSCQHFAHAQVNHANMTNRKLLLKVTSVSSALFTDFILQKFTEISLFPLHSVSWNK